MLPQPSHNPPRQRYLPAEHVQISLLTILEQSRIHWQRPEPPAILYADVEWGLDAIFVVLGGPGKVRSVAVVEYLFYQRFMSGEEKAAVVRNVEEFVPTV